MWMKPRDTIGQCGVELHHLFYAFINIILIKYKIFLPQFADRLRWIDGCIDGWPGGCMYRWMYRGPGGWMYRWPNGWMYRRPGGWMYRLMYRWPGGCIDSSRVRGQ